MSRKKQSDDTTPANEMTPRQQEIKQLQAIPRGERNQQQVARLDQLQQLERRERFMRVVLGEGHKNGGRGEKAMKAILALAACGNRSSYSYTPEEADMVVRNLTAAVKAVEDSFSERVKTDTLFRL